LLDCVGRRRSPATFPGCHRGRPPRNKGLRYPPDPPTVQEIIAVMRVAGETSDGLRLRGLVVVLWRAGPRISEALAVTESDLYAARGAILVRRRKGGRRREVGIDRWAWGQLSPWRRTRALLPVGALFCVLCGPARGRPSSAAGLRAPSHAGPRSRAASDAGLPHISSATRTPSRCRARAFPS
jgi:integrase